LASNFAGGWAGSDLGRVATRIVDWRADQARSVYGAGLCSDLDRVAIE
jgi:hypothetical protein